ncbi:MAG TPA: flagellar hook-length control protein FliK [Caulobacteraceae bacterium]
MSVGPVAPPTGAVGGVGGVAGAPQSGSNSAALVASVSSNPAATAAAPNIQAILAGFIGEALSAQDSLAPLLADLTAALQSSALPAAARTTAQQILTLQTPLDGAVTGETLRAAVNQSGLFLEAEIAAAVLKTGQAAVSAPATDLKALLLRLPADLTSASQTAAQQAAAAALGLGQAAVRRTAPRPPPPVGGGLTAGQPEAAASLDASSDHAEVRQTLHQEAQAALARLELMQAASTPKPGEPTRWAFELPVAGREGTGVAQFEISRDGRGSGGADEAGPVWRARFSLNLEAYGPVHAEVALNGGRTRVTLWAEREGVRQQLDQRQAELTAALAGPEGGDAAVRVLPGAPPLPAAPAGRLVNRTS